MTGHKPFAKPVSLFSRRRTYQSDSDYQRLCLEHFWVEKKPNLFGLAPAGRQALAPKSRAQISQRQKSHREIRECAVEQGHELDRARNSPRTGWGDARGDLSLTCGQRR